MSFVRVCLDPSFFWIAEHEDAPEAVKKYFERVVSMLVLHRTKRLEFFVHEDSAIKLYEQGILPSERHLERFFLHLQDDIELSIRDISKALNELLLNDPSPEDFWADAILSMEEPVEVLTQQIVGSDRRDISENSIMNFGFTWSASKNSDSYYFPRLQGEDCSIKAIIKVELSELDSITIVDGASIGVKFEAFATASSLIKKIDEDKLWCAGANEDALSLAINVMAEKNFGVPLGDLKFSFGERFSATAALCGGIDGGLKAILMNKIMNILCSPDAVEISIFRKTKDANSGPRIRTSDDAIAHRVHLTKSHEAFRLMFWKMENGHIEFANVSPKHEENIL